MDPARATGHVGMAINCLNSLSRQLKVNLLGLRRPDATRHMVNEAGKATLATLDYAATCWVSHLLAAQDSTIFQEALAENGVIVKFLLHNLLTWVEYSSLTENLRFLFDALGQLRDTAVLPSEVRILSTSRFILRLLTFAAGFVFVHIEDGYI